MDHDDVTLSADEEATFVALARSLNLEIPSPQDLTLATPPPSLRRAIVTLVGLLLLVAGGLFAATTAGRASQAGTLVWSLGTVTTLWAVVTGQPELSWGPRPNLRPDASVRSRRARLEDGGAAFPLDDTAKYLAQS